MKGNFHVRFLEEGAGVIPPPYSTTYVLVTNLRRYRGKESPMRSVNVVSPLLRGGGWMCDSVSYRKNQEIQFVLNLRSRTVLRGGPTRKGGSLLD